MFFTIDKAKNLSLSALFLTVLASSLALQAEAQSLRVVDCNGRTRALRENTYEANQVKVDVVTNPGAPAPKLKLVNKDGEERQGEPRDGSVQFASVPPGIWVLTSESPDTFFSAISFEEVPAGWWNWETFGTGAIIAGGVIGGILIHDHNSGGHGSSGGSTVDCPDCDPNAQAPSIPAFTRLPSF